MVTRMRSQRGFTLIEVVAAAALIGILATMLMPSLSGANDRVRNAKLSNDSAAIDQAIQVYRMDTGKVPSELEDLDSSYLGGELEFKDATGADLTYTADANGADYSLTGKNANGATISSPASKANVTPVQP